MKKSFLTLALLMTSTASWAGGYQLQEYSITNLGRSFAGAGLVADDYSAIAFNPAGMQLKGDGVQLGGTYAHIHAVGKGDLKKDGVPLKSGEAEIGANKGLPHFFAQKKLNERWTVGTGFYVPFGLGTYYKNKDWFGASHAVNSTITAVDLSVAGSYKISEQWSVGASVFAEYLEARLTSNNNISGVTSDMNAHDHTAPGYSLGIMYRPEPDTRFGVTYRSKTIHRIDGPHYLDSTILGHFHGNCSTKLVFPEHVLLSAYHKVSRWGLSAMARWTRWSRFDTLRIKSEAYRQMTERAGGYLGPVTSNTEPVYEDWKNVWMIGAGVDYDVNKNWTLRTGLAWDEGGVKRAETRTARVPDTNRWIASLGASYKTGAWQWDAGYSHVFMRHGNTNNTLGGTTLDAKYRMGLDLVGLSMQYHF